MSKAVDGNVKNKIGSKMSPGTSVVFMLNSLTGLSLLTMPYGFTQSGVVLGGLIVIGCMAISFMTATMTIEALSISNALIYEETEDDFIKSKGDDFREGLHQEFKAATPTNKGTKEPLLRGDTLSAFKEENRIVNARSEFKIRERVELGATGELVLHSGSRAKVTATLIYIMILSFTYGTASALVVTVNQSLSHTVLSVIELLGYDGPDAQLTYMVCVVITFCITLPLCFANLQNTKKFTMVIMCFRFLAIAVLLVIAIWRSIERVRIEGSSAVLANVPLWKPEGFCAVFGNAVFLCGIHHYLPSMLSPLEPQEKAPGVIIVAFSFCYILLMAICATAMTAFNAETHAVCSNEPGGSFCKIQPLYNLNFAPVSAGGGAVALFLLAYPAMAIASIPVAAITTRNTMGKWLNIKPPDPEAPYTASNIALTLVVVVPSFTVALITQNVQAVIQYVGAYAGLSVSFLCPLILLIRCRQALNLEDPSLKNADRPLKSPFGNICGYIVVMIAYIAALTISTKKLFFSPAS